MGILKTKKLLQEERLAPHKKLGQNFLIHKATALGIVEHAKLETDDTVIEVGPGLGALTGILAAQAGRVIALEADAGIVRLHEEKKDLPENVQLLHADVLKIDLSELAPEKPLKLVANLPYSISSPFLFHLIKHQSAIEFAVLMLQKELALRLIARPGTKEYGAPTILLASCAQVELLMEVGPEVFHPRPKVDSMVLRLTFQPTPPRVQALGEFDYPLFARLVRSAFGQRRKTLLNSLASILAKKEQLVRCCEEARINPSCRAETLTLEDFIHLSHAVAAQEPAVS